MLYFQYTIKKEAKNPKIQKYLPIHTKTSSSVLKTHQKLDFFAKQPFKWARG